VGNVEKIFKPNGVVETKRYLDGELIVTTRSDGSSDERYLLKDHLGSADLITDENAQIVQAMSFDAFGQRRNEIDYTALTTGQITSFDTNITRRGYTGHEGLDPVGLIHMNGRVYDPRLGRFVSADPFVQAPSNTQSLNRYAYVWNNPLSYTDPSGHFVFTLATAAYLAVSKGVEAWAVGVAIGLASTADALLQGASLGQALKSGIISGATAAAFASFTPLAEGAKWGETAIRGLEFGAIGGISNVLQGGKFGNGFLSAGINPFVGKGLSGQFGKAIGGPGRVIAQISVAGSISRATGGKFANGAAYAAFSMAVEGVATSYRKDVPFDGEIEQQQAFDQQEQAINEQIDLGTRDSKQQAIDMALDLYQIDTSKVQGAYCDANYEGSGLAKFDCMCVVVGDQALVNARVLGSTLGHEIEVHINIQMYGRTRGPNRRSRAYALDEVTAYDYEIRNQWRFRYSNAYREKLISRRKSWQWRADNAPF